MVGAPAPPVRHRFRARAGTRPKVKVKVKVKVKAPEQSEKKLLLAVSEDQWLGLKRIGLDQRLKAVCLDAFDAYIAKHH